MKSYKNKKKKWARKKKRIRYPMTGYVIYARDSTLSKHFEWVIVKGGISKTLNDCITYKDCYSGTGGANSVITRLTWGHTDCDNCMFRIVGISFEAEDSVVRLRDVIEDAYIYE